MLVEVSNNNSIICRLRFNITYTENLFNYFCPVWYEPHGCAWWTIASSSRFRFVRRTIHIEDHSKGSTKSCYTDCFSHLFSFVTFWRTLWKKKKWKISFIYCLENILNLPQTKVLKTIVHCTSCYWNKSLQSQVGLIPRKILLPVPFHRKPSSFAPQYHILLNTIKIFKRSPLFLSFKSSWLNVMELIKLINIAFTPSDHSVYNHCGFWSLVEIIFVWGGFVVQGPRSQASWVIGFSSRSQGGPCVMQFAVLVLLPGPQVVEHYNTKRSNTSPHTWIKFEYHLNRGTLDLPRTMCPRSTVEAIMWSSSFSSHIHTPAFHKPRS